MQPKIKPGTATWWNGPNQKTESYIYFLFVFSFHVFFGLYEYNQWRSVIFTIEITQRWIRGIAVFCKIVVFQG